ncbi:MAG: hypothetical protein IKE43_07740 [Coriobacteriales bacterium]|nr:hypothetical protein [Coriobacteriales bacterium]
MKAGRTAASAFILSLVLAGALTVGAGSAFAEGTIGDLLGSILGTATAPTEVETTPASEDNPFGVYDEASGLYTNTCFGVAYEFGDVWLVEAQTAKTVDDAYEAFKEEGIAVDLFAINSETLETILTQIVYNEAHETIDKAYLEENKDVFAQSMIEAVGYPAKLSRNNVYVVQLGDLEVPLLYCRGTMTSEGVDVPFYLQIVFIPQGDNLMMATAISFMTDTTSDLLNACQLLTPENDANALASISGMYDDSSMMFVSDSFGYKIYLDNSWSGVAPISEEDVALADEDLAKNGAVVDLAAINTDTGEELMSVILSNQDGRAINKKYVKEQTAAFIGAFLTAVGITPDQEYRNFSDGLLAAIKDCAGTLADSPLASATNIALVDSMIANAKQYSTTNTEPWASGIVVWMSCTATIDGEEVPVYAGMLCLPNATGDYVNMLCVICFEEDTTLNMLGLLQ